MASHLSCLGFAIHTMEQFQECAFRAATRGEVLDVPEGRYVRWSPGAGIELWAQVNAEGRMLTLNPHFAGRASLRAALTERIPRPESTALDGAFHAWANPEIEDPESGAYPFVFDSPDFRVYDSLPLPAIVDVQLAAFAHTLEIYPSEEAYLGSQEGATKFAPESFIPSGLFSAEMDDSDAPEATAMLTGRVLETAAVINPETGLEFRWIWVRTWRGEVDVVADPSDVTGAVVQGGIVSGSFWLSGRIREPLDSGADGAVPAIVRKGRG